MQDVVEIHRGWRLGDGDVTALATQNGDGLADLLIGLAVRLIAVAGDDDGRAFWQWRTGDVADAKAGPAFLPRGLPDRQRRLNALA